MNNTLSDIIQSFIKKNKKEQLFLEHDIPILFEQSISPAFKANIVKVTVKDGILFVKVNSAALRFELLTRRSEIITTINKKIGVEVLSDIIFQ